MKHKFQDLVGAASGNALCGPGPIGSPSLTNVSAGPRGLALPSAFSFSVFWPFHAVQKYGTVTYGYANHNLAVLLLVCLMFLSSID